MGTLFVGSPFATLPTYFVGLKMTPFNNEVVRGSGGAQESWVTIDGKDVTQLIQETNLHWMAGDPYKNYIGTYTGSSEPISSTTGHSNLYRLSKYMAGVGGYSSPNPYAGGAWQIIPEAGTTGLTACDPSNLHATTSSPANIRNFVTQYAADFGSKAIYFEIMNEPGTSVSWPVVDANRDHDWGVIHVRQFLDQLRVDFGFDMAGWSISEVRRDYFNHFYGPGQGTFSGCAWPYGSDHNLNHVDAVSVHCYGFNSGGATAGTTVLQSRINQIFFATATESQINAANQPGGYRAGMDLLRTLMDEKGFTQMGWYQTEYWLLGGTTKTAQIRQLEALADVCGLITHCQKDQHLRWKCKGINLHACNVDDLLSGTPGTGNEVTQVGDMPFYRQNTRVYRLPRYYAWPGIIAKFVNNYKTLLEVTASGIPLGPTDVNANAVQEFQACAGLSPAGTTKGIVLANVDIASAHTHTLDWGQSANAPMTITKLTRNHPIETPMQVTTDSSVIGATSAAVTLQGGEAVLLEIPLAPPIPPAPATGPFGRQRASGSWSPRR